MAKAAVQTTVRLDPELYERLKAAAAQSGEALNTCIHRAIAEWVTKTEGKRGSA